MFWQIGLTSVIFFLREWKRKFQGVSGKRLEYSTKFCHRWCCFRSLVLLPPHLLSKPKFFSIHLCLLEILDIFHPRRFWCHHFHSSHLFTFWSKMDCFVMGTEWWLVDRNLCFSFTCCNHALVHYDDLPFPLCSRELSKLSANIYWELWFVQGKFRSWIPIVCQRKAIRLCFYGMVGCLRSSSPVSIQRGFEIPLCLLGELMTSQQLFWLSTACAERKFVLQLC